MNHDGLGVSMKELGDALEAWMAGVRATFAAYAAMFPAEEKPDENGLVPRATLRRGAES